MTSDGIWEGITQLIQVFDNQDPAKTGGSTPSTEATTNKDGTVTSDRVSGAAVEFPPSEQKQTADVT